MFESFAPMRATRAAMFAAMCVALGAVGHAHMSGTDIPLSGLLAAFAVTAGLAWLAAGRRRGPVGISAAVLGVQGALHLVFSGTASVAPPAGAGAGAHHHHRMAADAGAMADGMAGTGGMADGAGAMAAGPPMAAADMAAMGGPDGMSGMSGMAGMTDMAGHGGGLGMVAAHVLAALLCALWLARGEAAVFRLARALGAATVHAARPLARALALAGARTAAVPPRPAPRPPYRRPRRLRGAVHAHAVVRRGPPGAGAVLRRTAPGRPARA
ncbi:hypothetical protein [Streptomyces sp. NPDC047014]|uniref:hypothetical protein n=1 Tax=Streptomyces sp. NPDC047014 TaxID=3155736 RepID=UPI0033CC70BB